MLLLRYFYSLLLILMIGCKQPSTDYTAIINLLHTGGVCLNVLNGTQECITLKGKKSYIKTTFEEIDEDVVLQTNHADFKVLERNFDALYQLDSLKNKTIISVDFKRFSIDLTLDVEEADLIWSLSPLITVEGDQFGFISIKEGKYKEWIVKFKLSQGELVAKEVIQYLD